MEWVVFVAIAGVSLVASFVRGRTAWVAVIDAFAIATVLTLAAWGRHIEIAYELKAVLIATGSGLVVWLGAHEERTEVKSDEVV